MTFRTQVIQRHATWPGTAPDGCTAREIVQGMTRLIRSECFLSLTRTVIKHSMSMLAPANCFQEGQAGRNKETMWYPDPVLAALPRRTRRANRQHIHPLRPRHTTWICGLIL